MTENENLDAIKFRTRNACGLCRFLWYLVRMRGEHRAMVRSLAEQLVKLERGEIPLAR